jgi:hypothetical protein
MLTFDKDTLKATLRQTREVMLDNSLLFKQVYKDQEPNIFIERGIKIGITRQPVVNIGK